MKQTAVEWFYDKVIQKQYKDIDDSLEDLLNQAKEMEKQQIIDAYIKGNYKSNRDMYWKVKSAEQYYNEKFNTK
jgi:hypothetical protein